MLTVLQQPPAPWQLRAGAASLGTDDSRGLGSEGELRLHWLFAAAQKSIFLPSTQAYIWFGNPNPPPALEEQG